MLAAMCVLPASATEGNDAIRVDCLSNADNGSIFQNTYIYAKSVPCMGRRWAQAQHGFDLTFKADVKFLDYNLSLSHFTSFILTPFFDKVGFGYSFDDGAFVIRSQYTNEGPDKPYVDYAKVYYPLNTNEWYELVFKFVGKSFIAIVNGIEVFNVDMETIPALMEPKTGRLESWDWEVRERSTDGLYTDLWFFQTPGLDLLIDNMAMYSGDYDVATDTATETFATNDCNGLTDWTNVCYFTFAEGEVQESLAAGQGCDGVNFNRAENAAHVHDLPTVPNIRKTATCTEDGYDRYVCDCGMMREENFVAALGHAAGFVVDTYQAANDNEMGITKRLCYATDRYSCNEEYMSADPSTGANKGLQLIANDNTSIYNGYLQVANSVEEVNDGVTVQMDVLPTSQVDKPFTKFGACMGSDNYKVFIGYSFELGQYVIAEGYGVSDFENADILASKTADFNNFEWNRFAFKRDGDTVALYLNGELQISAELDHDTLYAYDNSNDDNANAKNYFFILECLGCNLYLDNVLVAGPEFDLATQTGEVFEFVDYNNVVNDGSYISSETTGALPYYAPMRAGFVLGNFNHTPAAYTDVHNDRALYLDTDYTSPVAGYTQMAEALMNTMKSGLAMSTPVLDFSYQFDFCIDDYCTDADLLDGREAYIGGHINNPGNGVAAFAGYDMTNQQFVVGDITAQVGCISDEYATYPCAVTNGTWHNMKLHYYLNEDLQDVVSIYFDGTKVLTYTFEDMLDYQYYIFFPTFCDLWIDNLTVTLDGTTYMDAEDFTNGYNKSTAGLDVKGLAWSLKDGGVPTHVYEEVITPAGCTEDGYTTYTCSCGESTYVSYNQPATGHVWNAGVVDVEPTYDAEGVMLYTCTLCGETKTEAIPKLIPEFIYGDVDGNGEINNTDINTLKRKIAGYTVTVGLGADVDGNGTVNNTDINTLQRYIAGYAVTLGPKA